MIWREGFVEVFGPELLQRTPCTDPSNWESRTITLPLPALLTAFPKENTVTLVLCESRVESEQQTGNGKLAVAMRFQSFA
jgi:hypothetical protein